MEFYLTCMNRYNQIIGTGGIGSGVIYALQGNDDLGRNETRLATKLPDRDFCKLHIISHYLTVILNSAGSNVEVLPVGAVGDDLKGRELLEIFTANHICSDYVRIAEGYSTLHSVCFQFPDGSGGNITESRSASSSVNSLDLQSCLDSGRLSGPSVIFAVPEVPIEARLFLLNYPVDSESYKAASFLSSEIREVFGMGLLKKIQLLSINIDEARALIGEDRGLSDRDAVMKCRDKVYRENPNIELVVTAGGNGAYGFFRDEEKYLHALSVDFRNSAGAGDAFFAGLIIGKVLGLPFISGETPTCFETALCLSALSVESQDTINFTITFDILNSFINEHLNKWIIK